MEQCNDLLRVTESAILYRLTVKKYIISKGSLFSFFFLIGGAGGIFHPFSGKHVTLPHS